jgi:hypothetical protein
MGEQHLESSPLAMDVTTSGGNSRRNSSEDSSIGIMTRPLIAGGGVGGNSASGANAPPPLRKNSCDKFRSPPGNSLVKLVKDLVMMFFHCLVGAAVQVWQRGGELISNAAGTSNSASGTRGKSRASDGHIYRQVAAQDMKEEENDHDHIDNSDAHIVMEVSEDEFGGHNIVFPPSPSMHSSHPSEAEPQVAMLLEPESSLVLEAAPRLLTPHMMRQIIAKGLPSILETKHWKRLYCVRRDGDSFLTFVNNVAKHKFTLLAVQTMDDDIFGAFVDTEWEKGHGFGSEGHQKFYGTGQSFLFKVDKAKKGSSSSKDYNKNNNDNNLNQPPNVTVYKWTGRNDYNQLCSVDSAMLALGGGGSSAEFGLCIQDSFSRGSSGRCDTFDNPPLASREVFDILRFEVYGFVNHSY